MLLCYCFKLFCFYKNHKLARNQIDKSGVQDKKENENFTISSCPRSPQNLKFGHFMVFFCKGQQRSVPQHKTHVQSNCLKYYLLIKRFVLWCCRCHRQRVFLRSLISIPTPTPNPPTHPPTPVQDHTL